MAVIVKRGDSVHDETVKNKWQWDWVSKRSAMKEFVSLNKTLDLPCQACCVLCNKDTLRGIHETVLIFEHLQTKNYQNSCVDMESNTTLPLQNTL